MKSARGATAKRELKEIRSWAWACSNCKKNGSVKMKATDGIKPAMAAHFLQSPACKTPRLSLD